MKFNYIILSILILLLIGCTSVNQVTEPIEPAKPIETPIVPVTEPEETPVEIPIEIPKAPTETVIENETLTEPEEPLEKDEIKEIFALSKKKLKSYTYKYKEPSGKQYLIYVKGNKIKIDYLSDRSVIYIDTLKKTAEEYCITYSKCGRDFGKIADLNYDEAYIDTSIDWIDKITETEKIDEGFYYGKQSWKLNTNLGEVTIDSKMGFIYNIETEIGAYKFTEATFNSVKDSDVNVAEHILNR